MRSVLVRSVPATLALVLSLTAANATDLSFIEWYGLAPCKSAAARYCDRSGGMTMSNLLRCGAKLARVSDRIGNGCRRVLHQYGQL